MKSSLEKIGRKCFDTLQAASLALTPGDFNKELGRRNAERGRNSFQWFTAKEAVVAEALAKVIVPSEEGSPGIDEVRIFGPSAVSSLDKIIKTCSDKQHIYSHGLLSFEFWALKEHGCKFDSLSTGQQTNLFRAAQKINESGTAPGSPMAKVRRRVDTLTQTRRGTFHAARLYPMIRDDCLQIFYTSRASWTWLGYDGPPMEKGYSNLTRPR
jgi:hypothetical protein